MTELYSPDEAKRLASRASLCRAAAWIAGVLGLILCVWLCTGVRPTNTVRRLIAVISVSTLASWAVILLTCIGYRPLNGAALHIRRIETEEVSEYSGTMEKSELLFQIPGSITVQKVVLREGESSRTLHVDARKRRLLPDSGTRVRVRCRGSFITAFEVEP